MSRRLTIGWKVSTLNPALASLRYRALFPILALKRFGVKKRIIGRPHRTCLSGLDALVIVKSFTVEDYCLAQEAARRNIPIIFDLCDNVFIDQYRGKKHTSPADIFLLIASLASAVVVTTEPLAETVRRKIGSRIPVYIVPDGIETQTLLKAAKRCLLLPQTYEYFRRRIAEGGVAKLMQWGKGKLSMLRTCSPSAVSRRLLKGFIKSAHRQGGKVIQSGKRVQRSLTWRSLLKLAYRHYDQTRAFVTGTVPKLAVENKSTARDQFDQTKVRADISVGTPSHTRKILWFGNHGADHADFGMLDLLYIRAPLEKLAAELPLELVVVSNNVEKYNKHIRPLAIPSRYIEWGADSMSRHFYNADVAVIPNSLDAFSICKSSNRTVMALAHGLPVVATSTPALEPLRDCVVLDDFEGGLRRYLSDPDYVKQHVQKGKMLIEQLYGQPEIGRLWNELLYAVINTQQNNQLHQAELIVSMHLPQDIDLGAPILAAASQRGVSCAIWTSLTAMQRWPQLASSIRSLGHAWHVFPDDLKGFDTRVFPGSASALLTITETNLNPHRFTHQLTKLANAAGLHTATVQHGFENVGLSYSDDVHDISHVRFASRQIFTWGHLETLHPEIPQQTRKKCFPVGCPKPEMVERAPIDDWHPDGQPVIGIFENLHWHRYSDEYRDFFLDGVRKLAEAHPYIDFLLKPHNAGMWLTSRYKGNRPEMDNLIIVDPKDSKWENVTAPQLLGNLIGAITTPSTVALDAARIRLPVAVVAQHLDLKNYDPLPLICAPEDWIRFVDQAVDTFGRRALQEKSLQFVDRVLLPGNAAWRIVEEIVSHKQKRETRNAA